MHLIWNAPRGAVTSQLQIATEPTFAEPVFDAETPAESFLVSGLEEGRTHYWRVRLAQLDAPWSDSWTFVAGEVTNVAAESTLDLPRELTIEQNYPNPFNPSTTIRFGLPDAGAVTVAVYDLLGRRVATLVNGTRPAGWHEVQWNPSTLASGVYVYTIHTERQTRTRSLVLMR